MCDFGKLVAFRFHEPYCGGGEPHPISVLSNEKLQQVIHLLTPYKCEDNSRLRQLNICSNHLNFSTEFFKTLKKKSKCKIENCENRKDRNVTAAQSWAIFSKKKAHVPPGSPICANHRQQVNSWVSEEEQRESSNVEEEALNVDIIDEEGQEEPGGGPGGGPGGEAAWEKEKEEEDEGSGEPDLKKRKSFYDSSLRWTEMMF